ncbi:MAG: gliding-motility protein MglA [Nitrospinae bacterium]|nr:gliding-motility protein MglA [Nitrospinota bacterium]
MVVINYANRELTAKIVYYGPALCGKTTNLELIHKKISPQNRGQMLSMATEADRTLFFDLLPVDIGTIGGFQVKMQLFTVPGQTYYNKTRMLVLRGADGVVFVADSQESKVGDNVESMKNLEENLSANNLNLDTIPMVIQLNKQDLPPLASDEKLNEALNRRKVPTMKAVAMRGDGVMETFKLISREVLTSLQGRIGRGVEPAPEQAPRPVAPPGGQQVVKVAADRRNAAGLAAEGFEKQAVKEATFNGDTPPEVVIDALRKQLGRVMESNRGLHQQCEEMRRTIEKLAMSLKTAGAKK